MPNHWTAQDWTALLAAGTTFLAALATATVKILDAIHSVHRDVNSRMDQLVTETHKAALLEGRAVGRTEGRRQEQLRAIQGHEDPEDADESDGEGLAEKHGYGRGRP